MATIIPSVYALEQLLAMYEPHQMEPPYDIVKVEGEPNVEGFWFTNYRGERDEPTIEQLEALYPTLRDTGGAVLASDFSEISLALMSTRLFSVILEYGDNNTGVLIYGQLFQSAMKNYVYNPRPETGAMVLGAWRNLLRRISQRRIVNALDIQSEDLIEWNAVIDHYALPTALLRPVPES